MTDSPSAAEETPVTPPPLPSITASALHESRQLVAFARRALAALLGVSDAT
ncbi:MAG TPA: hypothetical protein VFI19_03615 [Nocardioides sp.]|jgi:hypothetical protein|nr:hypothetical protein [Nocardioides sp.]